MTEQVTKRAIFLNGPAGVGKEHIAKFIQVQIVKHAAWTKPRREEFYKQAEVAVHNLFGLFHTPEHIHREKLENEKCSDLLWLTYQERYNQFLTMVRQAYGISFLGTLMEHVMRRHPHSAVHIFSENILDLEARPIIDYIGPKRCLIIDLQKEDDDHAFVLSLLERIEPDYRNQIQVVKVPEVILGKKDLSLRAQLCWGAVKRHLKIEAEEE